MEGVTTAEIATATRGRDPTSCGIRSRPHPLMPNPRDNSIPERRVDVALRRFDDRSTWFGAQRLIHLVLEFWMGAIG